MSLTEAERSVLTWAQVSARTIRGDGPPTGWRYSCVAELLLAYGRLFTPAAVIPDGEPGACYIAAAEHAIENELAYVEGLAAPPEFGGLVSWEHAWCAGTDDRARDPSWPTPGTAYLGIPLTVDYLHYRQQHHLGPVLWSPGVTALLRHGLPEHALTQAGRHLPTEPAPKTG